MSKTPPGGPRSAPLPAPPAALAKVIAIAGDQDKSLRELGVVCSQDPGLTVELLRIANSARYMGGDPVRNVPQAVVKLGARAVRAHSITYSIRAAMASYNSGGLDAQRFWEDSLRRASAAQMLAEDTLYEDPYEAFALGLTQDLGTLLIAVRLPHLGRTLEALRAKPGKMRAAAERVLAGRTHPEEFATSSLAEMLPRDIIDAATQHHENPEGGGRVARLARIGYAADVLADVVQAFPKEDCISLAEKTLAELGAKLTLHEAMDQMAQRMIDLGADLAISVGAQPSLEDVMFDAQQAMMNIAMAQQSEATQMEKRLEEQRQHSEQLEESNRRLRHMATKDPLTGLDNRRTFNQIVKQLLDDGRADKVPFTVLMVDVDHFKNVNDTHGHGAGDIVLKELARRLTHAVRDIDTVARLGGEEFGILLPAASGTGARVVAERVRRAIDHKHFDAAGTRLNISVSVGGTTLDVDTVPDEWDELLELADRALYRAKRGGRNKVCWAGAAELER